MGISTGRSGTNGEDEEDGIGGRYPSSVYCLLECCTSLWRGLVNFVESLGVAECPPEHTDGEWT
jgi:hypothetical protein